MVAPALIYISSENPLPTPALFSILILAPAFFNFITFTGVIATRLSFSNDSFGIFIVNP